MQARGPIGERQADAARRVAATAGLLVESRDPQASLATLRTRATGAGLILALAILAMTIGLLRGEARADLRTLTATGATRRTRRTLTAATTGALALLGAILGGAAAYLALGPGRLDELESLARVPLLHLAAIAIGAPACAALAGWLLGGREPPPESKGV